jgi:hypothetical protein
MGKEATLRQTLLTTLQVRAITNDDTMVRQRVRNETRRKNEIRMGGSLQRNQRKREVREQRVVFAVAQLLRNLRPLHSTARWPAHCRRLPS